MHIPAAIWSSPLVALNQLSRSELPHWENYLGFYSSWLGGYFREPWAMLMPLDDHGFHRGDAVFEAVRLHSGAYFDLSSHLRRLENSSQAIGMKLPMALKDIEAVVVQLARLCATREGILRLFVTRGPGSFSPNPSDVVSHQIYAALTILKAPSSELYKKGCRAMLSAVPAKEGIWSQIKSCNYLQNVMMKAECVARGYDFSVSVNDKSRLCEGSTENMCLVSKQGELLVPKFDYTLRGTTMSLVMELAAPLIEQRQLTAVRFADLTLSDVQQAREMAFVGTTLGVLPCTQFEQQRIGSGEVGPVLPFLHAALMKQMAENAELRTEF